MFTLHSVIFSGALPSQVDDLAVGLPQSSPEQSRRAGQQPQEVEVRGQHELPQGLHTEERGAEGVRGEEGRARGRRGESGARRARGRQDELLRLFDDSGGAEDDNETSERRGRGRRHAFFLSMAETVKTLPPLVQARIKADVFSCVSAAEIKYLQRREKT
jgi:hypothetical protein